MFADVFPNTKKISTSTANSVGVLRLKTMIKYTIVLHLEDWNFNLQ